jgi:Putative transposase
VATGPRAGHPVRRLRPAAAVVDGAKLRCARLEGFSLHANVALPAHAREPLEHLCRYLLRPPLATERLTESSGGQLLYELPHSRLLAPHAQARAQIIPRGRATVDQDGGPAGAGLGGPPRRRPPRPGRRGSRGRP